MQPELDTGPLMLNLAACRFSVGANGPGRRLVFWTQGCRRQCPGCINPEMWPETIGHHVSTARAARLLQAAKGIEGITFTGGEPFLQAAGLAHLARTAWSLGLGVVCFTGYTLDELKESRLPGAEGLLASTDLLIAGPYVAEQASLSLWLGSTNQRMHFLTSRYDGLVSPNEPAPSRVEFAIGDSGIETMGLWPEGFTTAFASALDDPSILDALLDDPALLPGCSP